MSIKNLIKKQNRFEKEYIAKVVSNNDPLNRGRLQVKVQTLMGNIPFWVNAALVSGKVQLLLIPEPDDLIMIKFKNKDIYSGEWSLKGSPTNSANIDPNKYGLLYNRGNCIVIDRSTDSVSIKSAATTITANDTYINGNLGSSIGATELVPLENGIVLSFINGMFQGSS